MNHFVTVFSKRNIILAVILLTVCFILIVQISNRKKYENNSGIYYVDFSLSDSNFSQKEKLSYANTSLHLRTNGKFVFYGIPPQGYNSNGTWAVIGENIEKKIVLQFNCWTEEVDFCESKSCYLEIRMSVYKNDMICGYKNLAFRRKK